MTGHSQIQAPFLLVERSSFSLRTSRDSHIAFVGSSKFSSFQNCAFIGVNDQNTLSSKKNDTPHHSKKNQMRISMFKAEATGSEKGHLRKHGVAGGFLAVILIKIFCWNVLTLLVAFLVNNILNTWFDWPGASLNLIEMASTLPVFQTGLYVFTALTTSFWILRMQSRSLSDDAHLMSKINAYIFRAAFWSLLSIGAVDFILAFLYGEDFLKGLVGGLFAAKLANATIRGTYVHFPLVLLALLLAARSHAFNLPVLTLLVVIGELMIASFRFVYSYEQSYSTDLVRFWYVGIFLFGSAYTLQEEGHVRVDVFYAGFSTLAKAWVNILGTLFLGLPFCATILFIGFYGKTGVINSALLSFETEGVADGMYILYLMTVFMGVFAITMLIAFLAFLLHAAENLLAGSALDPRNPSLIESR